MAESTISNNVGSSGFETGLALTPEARARDRAERRKARHPYLSPQLLRTTLPFTIAILVAFALVPVLGGSEVDLLALALAAILVAMLVLASTLSPWQRLPAWARMVPPLGLLVVVALLREAAGEGNSGLVGLVVIVPVWAALYEGTKSLIAALVGVALTLILPVVLIGAPDYPPREELQEAAVILSLSAFVGFAVQGLVHRATDRASDARRTRRFVIAAMDSAVEGVVALDADGRVVYSNPSSRRMLGFGAGEMHGAVFHRLAQPGSAQDESSPLRDTLETGRSHEVRGEVFRRKDGSTFPVTYRCSLFTDPASEQGGAVVSFVDVSEQRRVERMKDELLSVVGHELRTPLTSIRGSLGLLEGGVAGALSPEAERMLEIAVANTDRLSRLINDILDIERIESGRAELARQLSEVPDLIAAAVETLANQAAEAEITLDTEPIDATLWADPDRIVQVLTNLISNAIKFSPPGSAVRIAAARDGDRVRFSVADRGRGIPADKLESVFERFGQIDASDSREKGGTGLGLPIARSIVHQHGGRMTVESEVGVGTTFSFTIPALPVPAAGRREDLPGGGPPAIVVEDDEDLARRLEAVLVRRGLGVRRAADAATAVRLLSEQRPDLIVLDLALPDADGSELVRWMRKQPELRDVALAVYTDVSITDGLRESLQLGPSIHVAKADLEPGAFADRAVELIGGPAGAGAGAGDPVAAGPGERS